MRVLEGVDTADDIARLLHGGLYLRPVVVGGT
jgi:hypothetical protein